MEKEEKRHRLLGATAIAARYCVTVENAAESDERDFIKEILQLLPRLYLEFSQPLDDEVADSDDSDNLTPEGEEDAADGFNDEDLDLDGYVSLEEEGASTYYANYVDEDYYESVRRHIEGLLGPDDVFLETFEEDMKYSDTPIAASVAECLADIFQPLYNFISVVKETDGDELEGAYRECHENFVAYWSQTLCNVLRALNNIYYKA
ncbi:MAG: DUF5063 domain-containing protein [Muribaculaceae bacterium]|nr:DUF5063 domain-containing protein [Muribaculaceae bacterium]